MREERTVSQIAADYDIHPNLISRWKAEFIENMPAVFAKGNKDAEKIQKAHAEEKDELIKQIGQLSVENEWLKKTYQKALGMKPRKS